MAWSPDYATTEELSDYLRVPEGDTVDAAFQAMAISAASRLIDKATGRQFGRDDTVSTRYYPVTYSRSRRGWFVSIDDLMAPITSLDVAYDASGDYTYSALAGNVTVVPGPVNALATGKPYTEVRISGGVADGRMVAITAMFGWADVPAGIKQATLLQASRFLARRESPYGVAGSPELGNELRLLAKLDPDVEVSIAPYKRTFWIL